MKEHLAEPDALVNLKRIPGLDGIAASTVPATIALGALCTMTALEEHAELARARAGAGARPRARSPARRSAARARVGGNLNQRPRCWYYRSEHAPCLKKGGSECFSYDGMNKYNAILGGGPVVHRAPVRPRAGAGRAGGEREARRRRRARAPSTLEKFFTLPAEADVTRETVLAPGEILRSVRVPAPSGRHALHVPRSSASAARSTSRWPRSRWCCWIDGGTIREARLVLGGVAPIPWRANGRRGGARGPGSTRATYEKAAAEARARRRAARRTTPTRCRSRRAS